MHTTKQNQIDLSVSRPIDCKKWRMNLEENVASRWDSSAYFQVPEQSPSRLTDRFINLRTTYWNRRYVIVVLAFIGLAILTNQSDLYHRFISSVLKQNDIHYSHYDYISYYQYGYYIGLIPGGVLATIYPAHNILGIFVTLSSISHLIATTSIYYLHVHIHYFLQFWIGTTLAVVDASIDTTWTYWVPLNKQSIRHIPIILNWLIHDDNNGYLRDSITILLHTYTTYTLTVFSGVVGLVWYVLWLYAINGNRFWSVNRHLILYGGSNNQRYSIGSSGVSLTRSIVSDIPWKSFYTSKPVLVIALLYVCDARLEEENNGDFKVLELNMRKYTIILLLLFVFLIELIPETIVSISTTSVRKFWCCSYFVSMGVFFFLEIFLGNILRTTKICYFLLKEMEYLYSFGFVNYLDIAPKYSSLLYSFLMTSHYISEFLWNTVSNRIFSIIGILNEIETGIMMAVMCIVVAVSYAVFGSAELQPWAADDRLEENQQNMTENNNIPSV